MTAPWPSVVDAFVAFNKPLEGAIPYLYTDILCKVTTSIGCLVDDPEQAAALPFVDISTGEWATADQIHADWQRVKSGCVSAPAGKSSATLWLTDDGMRAVVSTRLQQNVSYLSGVFPAFGSWPADAQLALLSLAWAAGANMAKWPNLTAALQVRDFVAAAEHGQLNPTGNPGLVPRNELNAHLWLTAAAVEQTGDDPSLLYGYSPGAVSLGGAAPPGGSRPDGSSSSSNSSDALVTAAAVGLAVGVVIWQGAPLLAPLLGSLNAWRKRVIG